MANELSIEAVRLALDLHQLRAEVASRNIASANLPDHRGQRLDFAKAQNLLAQAAHAQPAPGLAASLSTLRAETLTQRVDSAAPLNADEQVAELVSASLQFQSLTEAVNRHFGLMRLAVSGRN